ncbi:hypothetical protein BXA51_17875 [Enterococcus faecium]|uniref:helix-turn-helix domain-containing protein n=1 Tax=Enterococcus faecium TaxID=1352 RepID=UPI0013FD5640|nr:helix-turn-helix transcriptional regulator [Enterococcus faecium]KAF3370448.1 hypothetical protein BXA51_17875 [Enterococcus faecium]
MNGGENVARKKYPEAVETGQRIRLARIEKGLSMEQLGGKLSPPASKGAVSNWENGYNLPNNTRLKQLSKVLDVSTTYLLNGSYTLRDMHMMPEIKRNVIANKAVSTIYGHSKMVKKKDMTPEMLVDREPILDETVELMTVKEKYGLQFSVSEKIYNRSAELQTT